jgi:hypothetical protein
LRRYNAAHVIAPHRRRHELWTRDSSILLGGFFVTIFLIVYIWWPLAEEYLAYVDWDGAWWRYIDWLLLGIFGFMTLTIIARANLKTDLLIIFVGICGGLGDRVLGHADQPVVLLHRGTPAAVDHPGLADCVAFD